jgi:hypothetical protein
MNINRKPLYLMIKSGLGFALALGMAGASNVAFAQDAEEEAMVTEEVIVTGSRIVRDGFTSSSPLSPLRWQAMPVLTNSSSTYLNSPATRWVCQPITVAITARKRLT